MCRNGDGAVEGERARAGGFIGGRARACAGGCCVAAALLVLAVSGPPAKAQVFGPLQLLNTNAESDSGNDVAPRAAGDGAGNWVAVWTSRDSLGGTIGTDADILVSRSTDAGVTWTAPAALEPGAASDCSFDGCGDYDPTITTDGAGNWLAVWTSNNSAVAPGSDFDVLISRSTDAGVTWTAPAALNSNAGGDTGEDSEVEVTTDGVGNWVAVWRSDDSLGDTIGTDYDVLVSRSTDAGVTWTAPAALNSTASLDGLYADWAPQIATDGAGIWVAVWTSKNEQVAPGPDDDILVSRSTDAGATWTEPAVLNSNAGDDSGFDLQPWVTTDGVGNWVTVWYSNESLGGTIGTDWDILVARSSDGGATWTVPIALNSHASLDGVELDKLPTIATNGAGSWVTVWESDYSLGGTIGSDIDILVSRSTDTGATWTAAEALNSSAWDGGGSDRYPYVTRDAAGTWVAVWESWETLDGTIGEDIDVLLATTSRTSIPVPALGPVGHGLAALLLAFVTARWLRKRRVRARSSVAA